MPKMIVSIDDVVIDEVQITKEKTTLGRRPYNDIVIDNLAVSGEHASIHMVGGVVSIEDLNSTNGTYVNGKPIKKQVLQSGDTIDIGKYKIKFSGRLLTENFEKTMVLRTQPVLLTPSAPPATAPFMLTPEATEAARIAGIKVLSGAAAGRELPLTKPVTTIGKPGIAVAAITKRDNDFLLHYVEGDGSPTTLNSTPVTSEPVTLKNGDVIALAGTEMQFVQT